MLGRVSLSRLRLLAIVLPAAGVVALETAAQMLEPAIGSLVSRALAALALVGGIVAFSLVIFRVIQAKERTILDLYTRARVSAERLESLIESSGDAIITVDLKGRILSWSRGAEAIYGWNRAEAVGTILPMVPADLVEDATHIIQRLVESGDTIANYATERLRKDGQRIPVLVTVSPIRATPGDVIGLLGISKDMSTQRQLEQQERRLALLEDRERIGMELHDGAIQSLYAVGLGLEAVAQVLECDPGLARERLMRARDHVNGIMREIRNYIVDLRPNTFESHGLLAGITALARELEVNTLIHVQLELDEEADRSFSPEQARDMFQIAREALSNIARHASATHVHLVLRQVRDGWVLRVVDDGIGLEGATAADGGFGLRNMRERARRLNGSLTARGLPEGGTEVELTLSGKTGAVAA